jgi:hypothetical protein
VTVDTAAPAGSVGRRPTNTCPGPDPGATPQGLARLEAQALLAALARTVTRFELGEPERALNNLIRAFASVPVTVHTDLTFGT